MRPVLLFSFPFETWRIDSGGVCVCVCRATDLFFYGQLLEWEMCFCCEPLIYPPVSVYLCTHSVTVFLVPQWYNMGVNACRIWRQAASQPATKPTTSFKLREGKKNSPREPFVISHTRTCISSIILLHCFNCTTEIQTNWTERQKKR